MKRLSTVVGDEEVAERLAKTTDAEDIRRALSDVAGGESAAPQATASGKFVIGITSCPTGVAHTYMAQEALEKGAQVLGHEVKIETQGSVGADNVLTAEDIARADVVIIAADTNVDPARFVGKRLYRTGTKAAINDAVQVINTAFASAPIFGDADAAASASAKPERTGVYKHLMTGVSHMLPFVVAGGLLIALGFAIGSFMFGEQGIYIYKEEYAGTLGQILFQIGKDAFALFVPVLGAYIAYSIAGRPGIAPGMVGAYIAANTGAGFLGAIVAGFIAGYFVAWLVKVIKLPRELDSLKPMIILPLVGTAVIGLLMYYLIAHPVADAQSALETWLKSLQGSSALLLGALLGGMMALDMGGPVNKAAYLFSSGLIASDVLGPMAATMAAGIGVLAFMFIRALPSHEILHQRIHLLHFPAVQVLLTQCRTKLVGNQHSQGFDFAQSATKIAGSKSMMPGAFGRLRRFLALVHAFFKNDNTFVNQCVVALFIGVAIYDSPSKAVGAGIDA